MPKYEESNKTNNASQLKDEQLDEAAGGATFRRATEATRATIKTSKPLLIVAEDIEGEAL